MAAVARSDTHACPDASTAAPMVRLLELVEGAIYTPQWAPVIRVLLLVATLEAPLVALTLTTGSPSLIATVMSGAVGVVVGRARRRSRGRL
jgi:hypothetical protein